MNPNNGTLVTVLNNADIACGANGLEVVYYGQPLPFIYSAAALVGFLDAFSFFIGGGGPAALRIFGEFSIDGVTWAPFNPGGSATIVSIAAPGIGRGSPYTNYQDFGPLVRFNVGISNTAAAIASARVTALVNVRFF